MDLLWKHMRSLWPRWTLAPAAPFVLWALYCLFVRHEPRWELALFLVLVPALAYATPRTKRLYVGLIPFMLVGLLYDAMRFVQGVGVTRARVHLCDLRAREIALFGVDVGGARGTVHDWLQLHATPLLDRYFAIPYGIYLFVAVGYGFYLGARDPNGLARYGWTFFVVNLAGFATYHLYPAAPPWYFHAHGCQVDLAAPAYEGANLARVDRALGYAYFHSLYGRSHDVFGAIPSLHVTYPVLMLLVGWRRHGWAGRALMVVYALSMIGAALYLDHHWMIDVLLGLVFVTASFLLVTTILDARRAFSLKPQIAFGPDAIGTGRPSERRSP